MALDGCAQVNYVAAAMTLLAHRRLHPREVETASAAAVYLRPGCDSFSKRSLRAQIPANGPEPDP